MSAIDPPRLCRVAGRLVLGDGCRLALGAALALDAAAAFLLGAGFEARLLLLLLRAQIVPLRARRLAALERQKEFTDRDGTAPPAGAAKTTTVRSLPCQPSLWQGTLGSKFFDRMREDGAGGVDTLVGGVLG